ncbi:type VI secretion system baseplate subunit TssG [Vibrio lamellibrachiae]|uniref:type VI secretion system baseplate subunit TssG n=1 Tax=Vibrio lamellibrachiae TaxID=2910253 RepID=UPI003D0B84C6
MIKQLVEHSHEFSFFQAVSLLEKHYQYSDESEYVALDKNKYFHQETITFTVSPKLSFPKSDMESITRFERDGNTYTRIEVNFLGLHGSSSPLPVSYTEKLAGRDPNDNPVKDFFDFFHNRYLSMVYRVWKKYRYHVQYQSDAKDDFSGKLLHLAGLSDSIQETKVYNLDRAKLLSYTNQLSTRTRSPKLISGIVSHYFSLSHVEVEEWIHRRVNISECQRNQLNRSNCILGGNLHLGQSISDLTGKFNLVISQLSFEQYNKFSKGGELYNTLLELMKFILRDPMAWDLKLSVDLDTIPTNELGKGDGNVLGHTMWLGKPTKKDAQIKVIGEI